MIAVLAAIAVAVSAGVGAERRYGPRAIAATARIMDVLVWVLLPFITFFVIARLHLTAGVGGGLLLGFAELAIVGALAWLVATRALGLTGAPAGTVILGAVLANTGYLGIPLSATLLGHEAIGPAVAWDTVISGPMFYVVGFAIGAGFGHQAGSGRRERARSFVLRNPPLLALAAALVAPDALAPNAVVDVARAASIALLPVGFFILGVHLTHENEDGTLRFPPPLTRPLLAIVGLRLLVAPALFAGLVALLRTVSGDPIHVPDAYVLQAVMPCGINCLVVAHAFGLDLRLAAGGVAWTTAIAVAGAVAAAAVL